MPGFFLLNDNELCIAADVQSIDTVEHTGTSLRSIMLREIRPIRCGTILSLSPTIDLSILTP